MQHKFANVNGVRLHYVEEGEGLLFLFLHGFPEFWYEWKKQIAEFGRDFHAVAPDLRGYNLSSKPEGVEQYKLELLLEDIHCLIRHLGARKCTLAGHDWGGFLAWAFAGIFPDLVDKLIIINAPHPAVFLRELRDNPAQQQASQYMLLFRTNPEIEQLISADNFAPFQQLLLAPGIAHGYFTQEDRVAYLNAWSQPGALTAGLNYYRAAELGPLDNGAAVPEPLASVIGKLIVHPPTLVIWGEQDQYLLPGNLNGLEKFAPNLQVRRLPDASHWVIHERSAQVNGWIREFVSAKQAQPTAR
jgi:epoxide hydrolase 4